MLKGFILVNSDSTGQAGAVLSLADTPETGVREK